MGIKEIAESDNYFMIKAIELAREGMRNDEGDPFGAIIVKNNEIIGKGNNKVTSTNDPTAHAEIVAIRDACSKLENFQLEDCIIYTSCEPCPMCLGAIYWARPKRIVFACSKEDAANIGFDDDFIYKEIDLPYSDRLIVTNQIEREKGVEVFDEWRLKEDKDIY